MANSRKAAAAAATTSVPAGSKVNFDPDALGADAAKLYTRILEGSRRTLADWLSLGSICMDVQDGALGSRSFVGRWRETHLPNITPGLFSDAAWLARFKGVLKYTSETSVSPKHVRQEFRQRVSEAFDQGATPEELYADFAGVPAEMIDAIIDAKLKKRAKAEAKSAFPKLADDKPAANVPDDPVPFGAHQSPDVEVLRAKGKLMAAVLADVQQLLGDGAVEDGRLILNMHHTVPILARIETALADQLS